MRLPHADRALVDPDKVRGYLLSLDHPDGRDKARVFAAAGYSAEDWRLFANQLRLMARAGVCHTGSVNRFGRKYKVDGILRNPKAPSRALAVRTIWIVHFDEDFPRLVTAYPRRQR